MIDLHLLMFSMGESVPGMDRCEKLSWNLDYKETNHNSPAESSKRVKGISIAYSDKLLFIDFKNLCSSSANVYRAFIESSWHAFYLKAW